MQHPIARIAALLSLLLGVALLGGTVLAHPHLPSTLPVHFGLSGRADAVVPTDRLHWFLPAAIGLVNAAGLWLLVLWLPDHPGWINGLDRDRLRSLDREGRRAVGRLAQPALAAMVPGLLLVSIAVEVAIWEGAHGRGTAWLTPVVLLAALLSVVGTLVLLREAQGELDRRWREREATR